MDDLSNRFDHCQINLLAFQFNGRINGRSSRSLPGFLFPRQSRKSMDGRGSFVNRHSAHGPAEIYARTNTSFIFKLSARSSSPGRARHTTVVNFQRMRKWMGVSIYNTVFFFPYPPFKLNPTQIGIIVSTEPHDSWLVTRWMGSYRAGSFRYIFSSIYVFL